MNYATHPAWPTGDGWITSADRAILARAPRPVPLRASVVALVVGDRTRRAAGLRALAESARAAPTDDPWWRETYARSALEHDAEAHEYERAARTWARRAGT